MTVKQLLLFFTVPSHPLRTLTELSESDSVEAGTHGPNLTCTVTKTISGLSNMPSAIWTGPVVSGEGIAAKETFRNATTAVTILSFSELHTSHAGLYICEGRLSSPAADDGNITNSSLPIPVTVKCEWISMYLIMIHNPLLLQCQFQQ